MKEEYSQVNIEEAAERLQLDKVFIEELMKKFLDGNALENAEKAFAEGNLEEAKNAVHLIKGTSSNLGAVRIKQAGIRDRN